MPSAASGQATGPLVRIGSWAEDDVRDCRPIAVQADEDVRMVRDQPAERACLQLVLLAGRGKTRWKRDTKQHHRVVLDLASGYGDCAIHGSRSRHVIGVPDVRDQPCRTERLHRFSFAQADDVRDGDGGATRFGSSTVEAASPE